MKLSEQDHNVLRRAPDEFQAMELAGAPIEHLRRAGLLKIETWPGMPGISRWKITDKGRKARDEE
jgi:hypothetical protein